MNTDVELVTYATLSQLNASGQVQSAFNISLPQYRTEEISTRMVVKSGETVVMGGVLERERSTYVESVPVLGNLPYVGILFRRRTEVDTPRYLLVFVTATIVKDTGEFLVYDDAGTSPNSSPPNPFPASPPPVNPLPTAALPGVPVQPLLELSNAPPANLPPASPTPTNVPPASPAPARPTPTNAPPASLTPTNPPPTNAASANPPPPNPAYTPPSNLTPLTPVTPLTTNIVPQPR